MASSVIKPICAIIIKEQWDKLLKAKIGSLVSSSVINQALLYLSPFGFSVCWAFFKWVETIPQYSHSLQSSWTMICILTKQRYFKTAQDFLEKIARKEFMSSPTVLNALVNNSRDDPYVNSHVLSWLVIYYANARNNRDAIQVFEHMKVCGYIPHLHACTVLLNSLVKDKLTNTVWKTYKKMVKVGVVPNLHIYNVLINACCKSGDVERAEVLLSEMEFKNIFPDIFTFNTLISLYCKKGMHYEALSVQNRMETMGVCPDIVTYNSLIYSYCKESRMREALMLFNEIKDASPSPNHVTYTTLIDGYCRANDLDEALRVRGLMEANNLYLGVVTYNTILRKLCAEGRIQDAHKLLNQMSERRIEPDNITCNTLINAYSKIGDMRSATKVRSKMMESGLKPDQFTYKALIHGFCKAKDVESAKEVLLDMQKAGFFPSSCVYSWFVDFYNNDEAVLRLVNELVQKGVYVDVSVYRAIIRRLCRNDRVDCAKRVFDLMQEKGILGDSVVYTCLAYGYLRGGDGITMSRFLDEMYTRRLMVTLKIYRSMNASYAKENENLEMFWSYVVQRGLISKAINIQIEQLKL